MKCFPLCSLTSIVIVSFQSAKICNNMLLAIGMIGTAETMNLGIRYKCHEILYMLQWDIHIYIYTAFVVVTWPLLLTHRLGLDPKLLAKILNMSSGRCWSSDTYNPVPGVMEGVPSGNNYQGGFGTQLMAKVSSTSSSLFPVLPVVFAMQMLNFWTNYSKYEWVVNEF